MCEALIFVGIRDDLVNPYNDCKLFKPRDILAIQPDGWNWGIEELVNPDFRILKLPNVPLIPAQEYLNAELDSDPAQPSRMLKPRKYFFDKDNISLSLALRNWYRDDTRVQQTFTSNISGAQLLNFIITKPITPDPNIL